MDWAKVRKIHTPPSAIRYSPPPPPPDEHALYQYNFVTGNTFSPPEAALFLVLTQSLLVLTQSAAAGDESVGNGRTVQTVGSFSNDDSDGVEDFLSKMNLYFTFDCRNSAKSVQYAYWSKN